MTRFAPVLCAVSFLAAPAHAQYTSSNRDVLVPNTGQFPTAGVSLNGHTFVNLGLQGIGRIAANTTDVTGAGETFGSISDLQITNWARNQNGGYSGVFSFLPDRGYNAGTTFSNYAARINTFNFTFTPFTSSGTTSAQNQIVFSSPTSARFTYDAATSGPASFRFTTGLVADSSTTRLGTTVPVRAQATTIGTDGPLAGRVTLDSEGLALDTRAGKQGSGWVSDEYGPYIYHFNSAKQIDGVVGLPAALVPHAPFGTINFQADPPANGRRINQGMEAIATSPDGTRLIAMLQSATIQDSGSGNQGRSNARILVYDISGSDTPAQPIAQYLLQLPRVDDTGSTSNGATVNRAAAQSSILALSNTQLLILSRDGNGRGANNASAVFKSILLADLSTGTNLGTSYDAEGARLTSSAGSDLLAAGITPVQWVEGLNMLGRLLDPNQTEIGRFGLNLLANNGDSNTLSEKFEGLALVPVLDPNNPNDYFLFIGNDNDFITQTGNLLNADGATQAYNAGLENDTMVLAFRVRAGPPLTTLCHKRRTTISVPSASLEERRHLDHGDSVGACSQ